MKDSEGQCRTAFPEPTTADGLLKPVPDALKWWEGGELGSLVEAVWERWAALQRALGPGREVRSLSESWEPGREDWT